MAYGSSLLCHKNPDGLSRFPIPQKAFPTSSNTSDRAKSRHLHPEMVEQLETKKANGGPPANQKACFPNPQQGPLRGCQPLH